MNLRPAFLANILEPIYKRIKSIIPTNFWPFEFAPFIFMLILAFTQGVIWAYDIDAVEYYKSLINF
jgi:uncharacterized protein YggT (Ycf19 family)